MQPSHTRLICRAPNRFTPSIALWQQFVVPNRPFLHQQRLSSTAPEAVQGLPGSSHDNLVPPEADAPDQLDATVVGEATGRGEPRLMIRRKTTKKGHFFENKIDASKAKNIKRQLDARQASLMAPEKLLAVAKTAFKSAQEYEGVVVKPMVNASPVKESSLPWCVPLSERSSLGMVRLAAEIKNFHVYVRPDYYEAIARKHLIEQVRAHTQTALPDHILEVFGSERTGIALAISDIDFRLIKPSQTLDHNAAKPPPSNAQRTRALSNLRLMYWKTFARHKAYLAPTLRHARYPLISLQHRQSGLDAQIVLSNDTSVSRVIMQNYLEKYPYLGELYSVIKTMFDVRGLSDVFRGGFGSYSLFMMIVASIQQYPHPRNDAAGNLLNFLKFWRDFDTKTQGISIAPSLLFDKAVDPVLTGTVKAKIESGLVKPLPAYMLSLRDPADKDNDLGRKGVAIKHVQATFADLYQGLRWDLKSNTRPSLLGPLVGPSYMLYYARRSQLHAHGRRVSRLTLKAQSATTKKASDAGDMEADPQIAEQDAEDETKQPFARDEWEEEQARLVEQRNRQLRAEAESESVFESILGVEPVEEGPNTDDMTK